MTPLDTFVTIDVETAGFSRQAGFLLEVGLAFVVRGELVGSMGRLILPDHPRFDRTKPFLESAAVHGITGDAIRQAGRPEAEVAAEVRANLARFEADHGPPVLVAHSASFERRWLADPPWSLSVDTCSLQLARKALPGLTSHKLGVLVEHLGVDTTGSAHRAEADAVTTARVLLAMQKEVQPTDERREESNGQLGRLISAPAPGLERPDFADDLLRLRRLPHEVRTRLADQLELQRGSLGDAPDELLKLTLAGARLLLLRAGPEAEALLVDLARRLVAATKPRQAPRAARLALWGDQVMTPVGDAEVGRHARPGKVFRGEDGRLVALTDEELAKKVG